MTINNKKHSHCADEEQKRIRTQIPMGNIKLKVQKSEFSYREILSKQKKILCFKKN